MSEKKKNPRVERHSTKYPGVFFRVAERIGGTGDERVYYVSYKKSGKKIETKVGRQYADDMTPARANGIRQDLIEGRRITQAAQLKKEKEKVLTLSDIWQDYQSVNFSNKGIKNDINRFKVHLQSAFSDKQIKDITPQDIDRFKKKASELSPKTVKNVLEMLVRISNYAIKKRLAPGLTFKIEYPEINNETTEDLTDEQFENLLVVLNAEKNLDVKHIMFLAIYTGMRRSEIFKLKWTDINFQRGLIEIRNPKSGKDKTIPMNNLAREVFEQCVRYDSEYLFPGKGAGGHRVDINKEANRIKKAAGLPADFRPMHGLRHYYATVLFNSGKVDLNVLQRLMTHSSPAMTLRYAKIRDKVLSDASNVLSEIMKK
jgi:integrase